MVTQYATATWTARANELLYIVVVNHDWYHDIWLQKYCDSFDAFYLNFGGFGAVYEAMSSTSTRVSTYNILHKTTLAYLHKLFPSGILLAYSFEFLNLKP